jgi:hypothetical protein
MIGCTMHDPASALVDSGSEIVNSNTAASMYGSPQTVLAKQTFNIYHYLSLLSQA